MIKKSASFLLIISIILFAVPVCSSDNGIVRRPVDTKHDDFVAIEDAKTYDSQFENIAVKAVSVSHTAVDAFGNSTAGNNVENVYDGNLNTGYYTPFNSANYTPRTFGNADFVFSFANPITLNKVKIHDRNCGIRKYHIDISKGDNEWETVYEWDGSGRMYAPKYAYFPEVIATKVRIVIDKLATHNCNTIMYVLFVDEIEMFYVDKPEFYRLNGIIEKSEAFLRWGDIDNGRYNKEKLEKLKAIISEAKEYMKNGEIKAELTEEYVLKIRDAQYDAERFLDYTEEEYEQFITNVKNGLIYTGDNPTEAQIKSATANAELAKGYADTLVREGTALWSDTKTFEYAYKNYDEPLEKVIISRLYSMAQALSEPASPLYKDPYLEEAVIYAFDKYTTYWYGNNMPLWGSQVAVQLYGNGYFVNSLILLYDIIDYETLCKFACSARTAINENYIEQTGVNLYEMVGSASKLCAIMHDSEHLINLQRIMENLCVVFDELPIGLGEWGGYSDGYHEDGSYIYHMGQPYVNGYGLLGYIEILKQLANLKNTAWIVDINEICDYLWKWVEDTYVPLMWNGSAMVNNQGRNYKSVNTEKQVARNVQQVLAMLLENLEDIPGNEERVKKIVGYLKMWRDSDSSENPGTLGSVVDYALSLDYPASGPLYFNKSYRISDISVHHRGSWAFALSMNSERIRAYEAVGATGKDGWFMRQGATYFYDSDDKHYNGASYFNVINMMEIPGITAVMGDMTAQSNMQSAGGKGIGVDFTGSLSLNGEYGSAAYIPRQFLYNLDGRKSYFMFDDEIVLLGSAITSDCAEYPVKTIIDNRLTTENTNNFKINGTSITADTMNDRLFYSVSTMHYKGRTDSSMFGYYFPDTENITVSRKYGGTTAPYKDFTISFSINHGKGPKKGNYAYVVMPGKTEEETLLYKESPDIEILANEKDYHAVKEKTLGITAINNYSDSEVTADGITVDGASLVMVREQDNNIRVAICDPTMKRKEPITVKLSVPIKRILETNDAIDINLEKGETVITVNPEGLIGRTVEIEFEKHEFQITDYMVDGITLNILKPGTYSLILADFEDDILNDTEIIPVIVTEKTSGIINKKSIKGISLEKGDIIMLWNDFRTYIPLCEKFLIK